MSPDPRFSKLGRNFWGYVKAISQEFGYTDRKSKTIKIPTAHDIEHILQNLKLNSAFVIRSGGKPTGFGRKLMEYFEYRASVLNKQVQEYLMDAREAEKYFKQYRKKLNPSVPLPLNKQKGKKRKHAFFTGLVNMIIEDSLQGKECDYDPKKLVTFVRNGEILYTMSRKVDGVYPSSINPQAFWEIKEYYYTTTFGSRIADAVYETMLDGFERIEAHSLRRKATSHILMVDAYVAWWKKGGRPYLCRLIDILNMGLVDEIFFGKEIITELPKAVAKWTRGT